MPPSGRNIMAAPATAGCRRRTSPRRCPVSCPFAEDRAVPVDRRAPPGRGAARLVVLAHADGERVRQAFGHGLLTGGFLARRLALGSVTPARASAGARAGGEDGRRDVRELEAADRAEAQGERAVAGVGASGRSTCGWLEPLFGSSSGPPCRRRCCSPSCCACRAGWPCRCPARCCRAGPRAPRTRCSARSPARSEGSRPARACRSGRRCRRSTSWNSAEARSGGSGRHHR